MPELIESHVRNRRQVNAAVRGLYALDPKLHSQVDRRARELAELAAEQPCAHDLHHQAATQLLLFGEAFILKSARDFLNPDNVELGFCVELFKETPFFTLLVPREVAVLAQAFGAGTAHGEQLRLAPDNVCHLLVRRSPYDIRGHTFIQRVTPNVHALPDKLNEDAFVEQLRRIKKEVL